MTTLSTIGCVGFYSKPHALLVTPSPGGKKAHFSACICRVKTLRGDNFMWNFKEEISV